LGRRESRLIQKGKGISAGTRAGVCKMKALEKGEIFTVRSAYRFLSRQQITGGGKRFDEGRRRDGRKKCAVAASGVGGGNPPIGNHRPTLTEGDVIGANLVRKAAVT